MQITLNIPDPPEDEKVNGWKYSLDYLQKIRYALLKNQGIDLSVDSLDEILTVITERSK